MCGVKIFNKFSKTNIISITWFKARNHQLKYETGTWARPKIPSEEGISLMFAMKSNMKYIWYAPAHYSDPQARHLGHPISFHDNARNTNQVYVLARVSELVQVKSSQDYEFHHTCSYILMEAAIGGPHTHRCHV